MLEFVYEYGLFFAKTVTWIIAIMVVVGSITSLARQMRESQGGDRLEIRHLNRRYEDMGDALNDELLDDAQRKQIEKDRKARDKADAKAAKKGQRSPRTRVFVLKFEGDLAASAVDELREEITALLQVAKPEDEVLLRLQSEGGMVHSYGLAASQLVRIRDHGLRLTIAVDMVAASGGYMMVCVAHRIIAAPFAILGSIGVVAQLPNFNRLLKKHEVDFELHTAGDHKRTLTLFGENTEAAREKFRQELEDTHLLFKRFVSDYRPQLKMDKVATGEHWFGRQALELKLVDDLRTSDDFLLERSKDADLYTVEFKPRRSLPERLAHNWARMRSQLRPSMEGGSWMHRR